MEITREEFERVVANLVDVKQRIVALKAMQESLEAQVIDYLGEGVKQELANGTKVSVSKSVESTRFDAKSYLKDHPGCESGYMVPTKRKASVRVTLPTDDGEEW